MNAPVIPIGAKRFKNCSIEIDNLDTALFEKETDKRKRFHNARQRQFVFSKYAGKANADGSSCFPSTKTLAAKAKMSERQFRYWTEDLVELGFVVNLGYRNVGDTVTRERLLVIPAPIAALICTPLQDSEGEGCKIDGEGVQDRAEKGSYLAYNPPVLPANNPPVLPATPLAVRLGMVFSKHGQGILNKKGINKVLALPADHVRIVRVFTSWLKNRDLTGLDCPLFKFVEEFAEAAVGFDNRELTPEECQAHNEMLQEGYERERIAERVQREAAAADEEQNRDLI